MPDNSTERPVWQQTAPGEPEGVVLVPAQDPIAVAADLAAWLTEILDGDAARAGSPLYCAPVWPSADQILAQIAADRKILAHVVEALEQTPDQGTCDAFEQVLRLKTEGYADRPGYREEWRP